MKLKSKKIKRNRRLRGFVGTSLAGASLFQLGVPLIANAQTAAAGTIISNTATATYQDGDPADPDTKTINIKSNTVEITVAEVAGITVEHIGVTDVNQDSFNTGDIVIFKFRVTNAGNDTSHLVIPKQDLIAVKGAELPATVAAGNGFAANQVLLVQNSAGAELVQGTDITTFTVNPDYWKTDALIAPGDYIDVSVRVKVTAISNTQEISVQLGNSEVQNAQFTADGSSLVDVGSDGSPDTPNFTGFTAPSSTNANWVFTADGVDATVLGTYTEVNGAPVNGERHAGAYREIVLGQEDKPTALARLEKTGAQIDEGEVGVVTDNLVRYELTLHNDTSTTITSENLIGTDINLDTNTENRILVSDAIPAGTVLNAKPTVPNDDWIVVYTEDPLTAGVTPLELDWKTWDATADADPSIATRVGFILDPNSTRYSATAGQIDPGRTISDLAFVVISSGLNPTTGGAIYNIAQVFGSTETTPTKVIYDESGDQNPNNFDDGLESGPAYDPDTDDGIADATTDGIDERGDNTGTGPLGELNRVLILPQGEGSLLNGPLNQPGAQGPNNNNDDFTNATLGIEAAEAGQACTPGALDGTGPNDLTLDTEALRTVTFTNTVKVQGTKRIDNITIEPLSPTDAAEAFDLSYDGASNDFSVPADLYGGDSTIIGLPDGTKVVIRYASNSATYTYNAGAYTLEVTDTPINLGNLNPDDAAVNYEVDIILPATAQTLTGYAVPIVAFSNTGAGLDFENEVINNITINRAYAGFMQLCKQARILDTDGVTPITGWFDGSITLGFPEMKPSQIIEYRLTYTNVSKSEGISGNVFLDANNFTILEDGAAGTNNWLENTSHLRGTTTGGITTGNSVNYYKPDDTDPLQNDLIGSTDPTDGTVVKAYENVVTLVKPQEEGTFTFRRLLQTNLPE